MARKKGGLGQAAAVEEKEDGRDAGPHGAQYGHNASQESGRTPT